MNIITIDCGASFVKGALFKGGLLEKEKSIKSPAVHKNEPLDNPIQIEGLLRVVMELLDELSNGLDSFKLCFSNEMHGFILTDKDLNPIIDYISWQKEFGNIEIDGVSSKELLLKDCGDDILKSGMPLRAGLPSSNLFYLVRKSLVDVNGSLFFTLGDYITSKLSGEVTSCHPSNSAASGLFNLLTGDWNDKYIKYICGDKKVSFPKVGNESVEFSYRGKKVICYPALGDQQAALLGSDFLNEDELSFNLGTGAQVSVLIDEKEIDKSLSNDYQIRPYFNGLYLKTIPHIPSGRASNVFVRFYQSVLNAFGFEVSEEEIWKRILSSSHQEDLDISLSFFENAVNKDIKGSIKNISEYGLTFDNLSSSFIQQLGENFIKVANRIADKKKVKKVVFSGGIARKIKPIRDIILSEYPVEHTVNENETLKGLYKYAESK